MLYFGDLIQSHGLNTIQIPSDYSQIYNSSLDISCEFQTQTPKCLIISTSDFKVNISKSLVLLHLFLSVFFITTNGNFIFWFSSVPGIWPHFTFSDSTHQLIFISALDLCNKHTILLSLLLFRPYSTTARTVLSKHESDHFAPILKNPQLSFHLAQSLVASMGVYNLSSLPVDVTLNFLPLFSSTPSSSHYRHAVTSKSLPLLFTLPRILVPLSYPHLAALFPACFSSDITSQ